MLDHLPKKSSTPLEILDIGASSGVSTLELQQALQQAGIEARITGADLLFDGFVVELGTGLRVLTDNDGNLLQFDLAGVALRPFSRRLDWVTGYWAGRRVLTAAYQLVAEDLVRKAISKGGTQVQRVQLVSRRAQAAGIQFVQDDILGEPSAILAGRFDVIRVANLINRAYFGQQQIHEIVARLPLRLRAPGGLVVVSRTHDNGTNDATLLRYCGDQRYEVVARLGAGSEVEADFLSAQGRAREAA